VPPYVASNGNNVVLAWQSTRGDQPFVFRAVIDRLGRVQESGSIAKAEGTVSGIASDGDRYLITQRYRGNALLLDHDDRLLRKIASPPANGVASNGASYALFDDNAVHLLDRDGNAITTVASPEHIRAIVAAGDGYAVVTAGSQRLFLRMLLHGVLSDAVDAGVQPDGNVYVASNGHETLIALRSAGAIRFIAGGKTIDVPSAWGSTGAVHAAWNGSVFEVSYAESGGTKLARVTSDGTLLGTPLQIDGSEGVAAYQLFFDRNNVRHWSFGATEPYALYAPQQASPRIVSDGADALLVLWSEGTTLRANEAVLTTNGAWPAAAFDGRDWIIAYSTNGNIVMRRMSRDGVLSKETKVGVGGRYTRVASSGDGHFAIVWEFVGSLGNPDAGSIRASIDGGAPFDLSNVVDGYPDVAWDGHTFRVIWVRSEWRWSTPPGYIHQYTVPIAVKLGSLDLDGHFEITESIDAAARWPRVAGEFATWSTDQSIVVRRGSETVLQLRGRFDESPGFATDGAGHAMLIYCCPTTAVLIGSGDQRPFRLAPDAGEPDVAWTRDGWVTAFVRTIDGPPYFHAPTVLLQPIDFTPERRRTAR
jgi:hypothetical protein